MTSQDVFFLKTDGDVDKAVEEVFSRFGWENQIDSSDTVLVKPNFLTEPKTGVTTDLTLIASVINFLKKRASNVYVGETDSAGRNFDKVVRKLSLNCEVINLSKDETMVVHGNYSSYNLPKLALKSKVVNLPVLKTHSLTKVTLGVKNLFGLIQDKNKERYHIFKPPINILDAIYSMDGYGPVAGRVRKTNFIAASPNALTLDMAVCKLLGLKPWKVGHLKMLMESERLEPSIIGGVELYKDFKIPDIKLEKAIVAIQRYPKLHRILISPLMSFIKTIRS
jgi:uncharacterized protein (DUF362 family)